MWLLFTVAILLTREVVANFETDDNDGEKNMEILARHALNSNLKMLAAKLHENDYKTEDQDSGRRKRLMEEVGVDQGVTLTDFEKKNEPVSSLVYWRGKEAVIPIQERSKESNDENKSQRFSPWGGKRIDSYLSSPDFQQTVHVFNNWGGKRGNEISKRVSQEESRKLYAWNRPDSDDNMELKRVSKSNSEGKVPFNSWGGKRSLDNVDFTSRILEDLQQLEEKIGFHNKKGQYQKIQEKLMRKIDERRMPLGQKFESWGGKRLVDQEEPENANVSGEHFFEVIKSRIPKKRSDRALRHKSTFQPWGGKRNSKTTPEIQKNTVRRQPASYFVRKVFFPWGG